ncbi:hypothetical protein BGX27_010980 [Mortierella sp. AM989]|nr:hypothetical protein BGX27_010980 [Mortierella sp. AM989]
MPHRTSVFSCTILSYISTILLCISFSHVLAQTFQPVIKTGSLSAFADGKAMYVLGGDSGSGQSYSTQAFMIDLSVSWNATSPAYKSLPDGPVGFYQMANALSPDGETWFAQNGNTAFFFDVKASKWTSVPDIKTSDKNVNSKFGLGAATDPETGIIYIPNGLVNNNGQYMLKLHPDRTTDSTDMSSQMSNVSGSTVAWSSARQSMIYLDESTGNTFSYSPKEGWSQLNVTGAIPIPRSDACLVAAYEGTKMILFGGYDTKLQASLNTIHILDTPTLTWTSGHNFDQTIGRMGSACAASGDYFIAWGGKSRVTDLDELASNAPLVYNIKNNTWTSSYIAPDLSIAAATKSRTRAIAISGAVLGTVALVGILGYIYYRHRQSKKSKAVDAGDYLHPPPVSNYYEKTEPSSIASITGGIGGYRMSDFNINPTNPPTYSMATTHPAYR